MRRFIVILFGLSFSMKMYAFPCFLTMVKDQCWDKYTITINVMNSKKDESIMNVIIPQGQSWVRQPFDCEPAESITLHAQFSPVFWEKDEGKIYSGIHDWQLPESIKKDEKAWNITVCYPKDFSAVPLPPEAKSQCGCIRDNIPPVEPPK